MSNKCYSVDNETFNMTDFSELHDQLGDLGEQTAYWEADAIPILHTNVMSSSNIDDLLTTLDERAGEDIGEVYDDCYVVVSKPAKEELLALLLAWSEKHVDISRYYYVKNIIEKKIVEECTLHV